jgi:hypothetical protein
MRQYFRSNYDSFGEGMMNFQGRDRTIFFYELRDNLDPNFYALIDFLAGLTARCIGRKAIWLRM